MNFDEVLAEFVRLVNPAQDEKDEYSGFVSDAVAELSDKLLQNAVTDKNSRRLTAAAAALAAYRYRLALTARGEFIGFKAGDVTISDGAQALAAAKSLYCERLEEIADLMADDYFVFRRVNAECTQEV